MTGGWKLPSLKLTAPPPESQVNGWKMATFLFGAKGQFFYWGKVAVGFREGTCKPSPGWNSMDLVCRLGSLVMSPGIVYCTIYIYIHIFVNISCISHLHITISTKSHAMLSSFIHTILISWCIHDLFQYAFWQLFFARLQREQVITFADLAVRF